VAFSSDLLTCIDNTIDVAPDFGALGMVGIDSSNIIHWSNPTQIKQIVTFDGSFIMIRMDMGIRFDDINFNELHGSVEDYCMQIGRLYGKNCYTLLISSREASQYGLRNIEESFLDHYSVTAIGKGYAYFAASRWREFRNKLEQKWPGIKTTNG